MRLERLLLLLVVTLAAATPAAAQKVRLKIATMAPDGSVWMKQYQTAADAIEDRTGGRVSLRFYPGGTMGSDTAVLRKIRIGQLHGGALLAGGLSVIDQDFDVYSLPLLFGSLEEVDYVRQQVDDTLMGEIAKAGFVAFGIMETGFTYLMSAKPTRSFDDLRGRKAWIPLEDPVARAIVDAAGLSPVPLPISDVLTGLQTGLIDTVAAPPVGAIALQWFTRAPYITEQPLTYVCGALVITEKALGRLKPADREVVTEVLAKASDALNRQTRAELPEIREALVKQGVTFVEPTDESLAEWNTIAAQATERLLAERDYDPKLVAEIRRLVQEYRASRRAGDSGD